MDGSHRCQCTQPFFKDLGLREYWLEYVLGVHCYRHKENSRWCQPWFFHTGLVAGVRFQGDKQTLDAGKRRLDDGKRWPLILGIYRTGLGKSHVLNQSNENLFVPLLTGTFHCCWDGIAIFFRVFQLLGELRFHVPTLQTSVEKTTDDNTISSSKQY